MPGTVTEPSAADWLAEIARGDLAAFQRFYQRFAPSLLGYVRQLSRDPTLAEDLLQEVFVTVWQKAASYRPDRGDAAGWLFTIARNKLIDHWRRTGGSPQTAAAMDFELLPARAERGSDLLLTLRKVLAQVSPDQRRAIELAYFGGLTYEETAERLRLPLGTLKSRIRLGLRTMRTLLESG
jgi:RNA polymerase sigma-70 factor (ECF subfamily)